MTCTDRCRASAHLNTPIAHRTVKFLVAPIISEMYTRAFFCVLLACALIVSPAHCADERVIKPFAAIGLCVPFNVRIEHPTNGQYYKVIIDAETSVISAVNTTWSPGLEGFSQMPQHGALSISANSSFFKSDGPVQITIRIPPKVTHCDN